MKVNLKSIIDFISIESGVDVSKYEESFFESALQKRVSKTKCESLESYCQFLGANKSEMNKLLDNLTVSYSEFFRNPLTFSLLEEVVLPQLIMNNKLSKRKEIRIWSSACAAGQEVYSLSMIIHEGHKCHFPAFEFRIFASDSNQEQVQLAKQGVYKNRALKNISSDRLTQWFDQQVDGYIIKDELKKHIDFSVFDLFDDSFSSPPASIFGGFDIVFCANILFYYSREYRKAIVDKVNNSLCDNGLLITGETERELLIQYGFSEVLPYSSIFRKKDKSGIL